MSGSVLYVFDDRTARRWAPFTLTRPAGELAFGSCLLRERSERALRLPCVGHLTRSALEGFREPGAAPVIDRARAPSDVRRILVSSRVALAGPRGELPAGGARLTLAGRTVGWVLAPGVPLPEEERLLAPERDTEGPEIELEGALLSDPWELVTGTGQRLADDLRAAGGEDATPSGVVRLGEDPLVLADGAGVEPGVVVDTREGPVHLGAGVRVEGPARLVGPLCVGAGSVVFGGSLGRSWIGPVCKVRGEVTDSVLLGFVNKAHDGHLGHALLGRWVNLGAMTTNSDLKNNYGTVRMWTLDGIRDTGLVKVGCFLGDHVKTGIGTLINTGTVIGAGSNVFGGLMPPAVVPPFSWGSGTDLRDYRLDKFFEVAERTMARRGHELDPDMRSLLARAWRETRVRRAV